jgi:hypothetical protein
MDINMSKRKKKKKFIKEEGDLKGQTTNLPKYIKEYVKNPKKKSQK